jgi:hypothetical protein
MRKWTFNAVILVVILAISCQVKPSNPSPTELPVGDGRSATNQRQVMSLRATAIFALAERGILAPGSTVIPGIHLKSRTFRVRCNGPMHRLARLHREMHWR